MELEGTSPNHSTAVGHLARPSLAQRRCVRPPGPHARRLLRARHCAWLAGAAVETQPAGGHGQDTRRQWGLWQTEVHALKETDGT